MTWVDKDNRLIVEMALRNVLLCLGALAAIGGEVINHSRARSWRLVFVLPLYGVVSLDVRRRLVCLILSYPAACPTATSTSPRHAHAHAPVHRIMCHAPRYLISLHFSLVYYTSITFISGHSTIPHDMDARSSQMDLHIRTGG